MNRKIIFVYIFFLSLYFITGQNKSVSSKIIKEGKLILILRLEDSSLLEKLVNSSELDIVVRNQSKAKAKFLGLAHRALNGVVQTGEDAFANEFGVEVFSESTLDGEVVAGDKLVKGSKLRLKSKDLDFLAYVENIR